MLTRRALRSGIKQRHLCRAKPLMWFCLDMKSAERQLRLRVLGRGPGTGAEKWLRQRGTFPINDPSPFVFILACGVSEHICSLLDFSNRHLGSNCLVNMAAQHNTVQCPAYVLLLKPASVSNIAECAVRRNAAFLRWHDYAYCDIYMLFKSTLWYIVPFWPHIRKLSVLYVRKATSIWSKQQWHDISKTIMRPWADVTGTYYTVGSNTEIFCRATLTSE